MFQIIRRLFPNTATAGFVELWVLGHTMLALIAVGLAAYVKNTVVLTALIIYGGLRVFEIVVYQLNVLLFDEYRARKAGGVYALHGYRRIVILLLHNYLEIIFWFAATYLVFAPLFDFRLIGTNGEATMALGIYSSFVVMTTFGDPNVSAATTYGVIILFAQSIVGLFMTLLSLARFISLIPIPDTRDEFEKRLPQIE